MAARNGSSLKAMLFRWVDASPISPNQSNFLPLFNFSSPLPVDSFLELQYAQIKKSHSLDLL